MSSTISTPKNHQDYLPKLPENWGRLQLDQLIGYLDGRVFGLKRGIPPLKEHNKEGGIPYVKSEFIKGYKFIEVNSEVQRVDVRQVPNDRIFEQGSLFITRVGENAGKASIIKERATAHEGVILTFFDPKKVYGEYVYWWFRTKDCQTIVKNLAVGVAQKSLSKEQIKSIEIPLPYPDNFEESLKIQNYVLQRINTLMSEVMDARSILEDMSNDTNLILDATLTEIFNDEIRQNWTNNRVFSKVIKPSSREISPERQEPYTHLQYISGDNIEKGTGRLLNERTLEQTKKRNGTKKLFSNAVLYQNLHPELRKVVYIQEEGICSEDIIPFQIQSDVQLIPRFLMWFLVSPYFTEYVKKRSVMKKEGSNTDRQRINLGDINEYLLYFPSLEDQERIVKRLDHVQSQVGEMQKILEAEKELLTQLELSILARAFQGEL